MLFKCITLHFGRYSCWRIIVQWDNYPILVKKIPNILQLLSLNQHITHQKRFIYGLRIASGSAEWAEIICRINWMLTLMFVYVFWYFGTLFNLKISLFTQKIKRNSCSNIVEIIIHVFICVKIPRVTGPVTSISQLL